MQDCPNHNDAFVDRKTDDRPEAEVVEFPASIQSVNSAIAHFIGAIAWQQSILQLEDSPTKAERNYAFGQRCEKKGMLGFLSVNLAYGFVHGFQYRVQTSQERHSDSR